MSLLEDLAPAKLPVSPISTSTEVVVAPAVSPVVERRWLGIFLCALAGASYGTQAIFGTWAYHQGVNTTTLLTMRFVVGGSIIWLLVPIIRPRMRVTPRQLAGLGILGVLFTTSSLFYYLGLNLLPAGTTALLGNTFPVWVILWAVLFFGERLDRNRIIALFLAVGGCALTVDPVAVLTTGAQFSLPGAILALGSAFSNSIYIVLSGKFSKGLSGLAAAAWSIPVTTAIFLIWCVISGQFQWDNTLIGWLCCLAVGGGTALSIIVYQAGIQIIGSSRAAITATTEPAAAVLLGILLLNEPASPIKLTGGLMIMGAIVLLSGVAPKKPALQR